MSSLLDTLNNIRLGSLLEKSKTTGKPKETYMLEVMSKEEEKIIKALNLLEYHKERPKINGVGVYGE